MHGMENSVNSLPNSNTISDKILRDFQLHPSTSLDLQPTPTKTAALWYNNAEKSQLYPVGPKKPLEVSLGKGIFSFLTPVSGPGTSYGSMQSCASYLVGAEPRKPVLSSKTQDRK